MVGGLLIAVAAVGAFLAAGGADGDTGKPVVVAAVDLRPGQVLEAEDLEVAMVGTSGTPGFGRVEDLVGRAVLGPVGDGEVVQPSSVSPDRASGTPRREVALALPRQNLAVGSLRVGDRVDVFVTDDEETRAIAQGVEVMHLATDDERSLTSEREVRLVVAVESPDAVAALVHSLRTGEVTVVRSTFAAEQTQPLVHRPGGQQEPSGE